MSGIRFSPLYRHPVWLAFIIAAPVLTAGMLVWAFSFHNTAGFYRVTVPVQPAVAFIVLFSLIPAILTGISLRRNRDLSPRSRLGLFAAIIAISGIILPVTGFSYFGGYSLIDAGDKPVQLLVLDRTGSGATDIAVVFWTQQPSRNTLKWDTGISSGVVVESITATSHRFALRDLPYDTEVSFRINQGETRRFRTPPKPEQPLRFAVASDAHFGAGTNRPDLTRKMLQQIADPRGQFSLFLFAGDLVEHGYNDAHWQEALSTITSCTASVPSLFATGNHDAIMGGLTRYLDYVNPGGRTGPLWRRVDISGVHFFVLDREWNHNSILPERKAWLEKELAAIPPGDWTVVISHAYYYASGGVYNWYPWYDDEVAIRELVPLFEKYDVDLVFSGHAHQLELLQRNGVTYVICGGFGGSPDPIRTYTSPAGIWYQPGHYGYMDVTLGLNGEVVFRDPDGKTLRSLTVTR